MVKVGCDRKHKIIIIEFKGDIDIVQAEEAFLAIETLASGLGKGFKVLADYSSVDTMAIGFEEIVKKSMRVVAASGVSEVLRVLPNAEAEFGFDTLSRFFYPKSVRQMSFRSRREANAQLRREEARRI